MFEFENREAFPSGLKVLVVDADSRSLLALERLLLSCHYQVTICHRASDALSLLREKEGFFDIVMCEIHLPGGMNGVQFLEIIIGLQGNSLPVVMMSRDGRQDMVMKIIMKGACDYLLKPVRIEEIRVIWQHVVRRKTNTNLCQSNALPLIQSPPSFENNDREEKAQDQAKDVITASLKKPRMVWTAELHDQFVAVVNQVGLKNAVPKKILELMNVPSLSRENVASHLQKYRLHLRRKNANTQQNKFKFAGTNDCSGDDLHSNSDSKRVESQSSVFSEVDSEKMSVVAAGNYPLDQQIMSCYDHNQALSLEESDNFIMMQGLMQQKLLDHMNVAAAAYVSVSMEDENEGEDTQNASSFLLNDDGYGYGYGYGYDHFCSKYEPTYF